MMFGTVMCLWKLSARVYCRICYAAAEFMPWQYMICWQLANQQCISRFVVFLSGITHSQKGHKIVQTVPLLDHRVHTRFWRWTSQFLTSISGVAWKHEALRILNCHADDHVGLYKSWKLFSKHPVNFSLYFSVEMFPKYSSCPRI